MNIKRHYDKKNCECYYCQYGEKALQKLERSSIIKYGWYAHVVEDDCAAPNHFNLHTHGLMELYGHYDLQCCMPMDPNRIMTVFHDVIDSIVKKGGKILPNFDYPQFLTNGYQVRFILARECGRNVLRMLIPDKAGRYDSPIYKEQLTMLDHI